MQRGAVILLITLALLALAEGLARLAEWVHPGGDRLAFAYSPYRMLKMARAPWPLDSRRFSRPGTGQLPRLLPGRLLQELNMP